MKIDNHLENRSFLLFEFYTAEATPVRKLCELMENVKIRESSSSKLASYTPIGRNGSVFMHMGSESRKFKMDFNLTLPNIMEYTTLMGIDETPMERYQRRKQDRKAYFENDRERTTSDVTSYDDLVRTVDRMFDGYLTEREFLEQKLKVLGEGAVSLNSASSDPSVRIEAIKSVLFWLNLIRSSTLTHATKPYLGPPTIRLTHGIVYQNVPCIATNYNISIDGAAGYDNKTLLPRVIKVSLDLTEVRLSSRSEFKPNGKTKAEYDQNVGWEVMVDKFVSYNRISDESITFDTSAYGVNG